MLILIQIKNYRLILDYSLGKTSLLAALAGQLKMSSGSVEYRGSVAYATQQPWLTNDTVKNNIIFYDEYDEERYANAVSSCQLLSDFEQFVAGTKIPILFRSCVLNTFGVERLSLNH